MAHEKAAADRRLKAAAVEAATLKEQWDWLAVRDVRGRGGEKGGFFSVGREGENYPRVFPHSHGIVLFMSAILAENCFSCLFPLLILILLIHPIFQPFGVFFSLPARFQQRLAEEEAAGDRQLLEAERFQAERDSLAVRGVIRERGRGGEEGKGPTFGHAIPSGQPICWPITRNPSKPKNPLITGKRNRTPVSVVLPRR